LIRFLLSLCGLALLWGAPGCSNSSITDIFPPFDKGDPGNQGFIPNDDGTFQLFALESGAVYGNGAPALEAVFPEDGDTNVPLDSVILLRFSETMNPDQALLKKGVKVRKQEGSNPEALAGTYGFAPGSAGRLLVFQP